MLVIITVTIAACCGDGKVELHGPEGTVEFSLEGFVPLGTARPSRDEPKGGRQSGVHQKRKRWGRKKTRR